jgi:hypothetical protein
MKNMIDKLELHYASRKQLKNRNGLRIQFISSVHLILAALANVKLYIYLFISAAMVSDLITTLKSNYSTLRKELYLI